MTKQLVELENQLEAEGYEPETPRFERALRARRVKLCQELRSVLQCEACDHFDHCELAKSHLRDVRLVGG